VALAHFCGSCLENNSFHRALRTQRFAVAMSGLATLTFLLTFPAAVFAARGEFDSKLETDAKTSIHLSVDTKVSAGMGSSNCDLSRYPELAGRFLDQRYAGEGANGCVILAKDKQNHGIEVAVKLAKFGGKLPMWREECKRSRSLHKKACATGDEQLLLAERYLPICLEVGGTDSAPFIVMHAAGGKGIVDKRSELYGGERISVFAQMVGALTAIHGVGLSHNDLHEENVVILDRSGGPQVAFIDFGEVVPLSQAMYQGGYKQDENLIAREASLLANCPNEAKYPFLAETIDTTQKDQRKQALFKCLKDKWGKDWDATSFDTFLWALGAVIDEAYSHQHNRQQQVTSTQVATLYHTAFVQRHQPALQSLFPAHLCGSVGEDEMQEDDNVGDCAERDCALCPPIRPMYLCHAGVAQNGCQSVPWNDPIGCTSSCKCQGEIQEHDQQKDHTEAVDINQQPKGTDIGDDLSVGNCSQLDCALCPPARPMHLCLAGVAQNGCQSMPWNDPIGCTSSCKCQGEIQEHDQQPKGTDINDNASNGDCAELCALCPPTPPMHVCLAGHAKQGCQSIPWNDPQSCTSSCTCLE